VDLAREGGLELPGDVEAVEDRLRFVVEPHLAAERLEILLII